MNVFRLHIRPSGGLNDQEFSFAYCLRQNVLGMGWQLDMPPLEPPTWETYERAAAEVHGGLGQLSRVRYFHDQVRAKDLIWTRDTTGNYYIAKVLPPRANLRQDALAWEYFDTPEGRQADIVNVVRCRIIAVPAADDVPGKIVACFRPSRTIQSVTDKTAVLYSQLLWNRLSGTEDYALTASNICDIFAFLDAQTTEDVFFIYLQCMGWIVVPNSRMADTMRYEFIVIHRETHERALVQVKTGNTPLDTESWAIHPEKIFLFQTHGIYTGMPAANAVCIEPGEIERFLESHYHLMPKAVQRWIDFVCCQKRAAE